MTSILDATVSYLPVGASQPTNITCYVDELSIHHGRDDTDSQPDTSTATIDIAAVWTLSPPLPALDIGGNIQISRRVGTPGVATQNFPRFQGRITDISQGWDDAGPYTPESAVMQVLCAGVMGDLGRRVVGDSPWPQQLDGARVSAIMSAAGMPLNPATSDPGTVQILARDVDSQPALDLAQAVAADAGGVLWETIGNVVRYADAEHRRATPAKLEIDACDILVTPTWQRNTAGLVNQVSIGYGVAPEGADQPRFTAQNAVSIGTWGTWALSATTQLASLNDASAMGTLLLARNSEPVWILGALPVDIKGLSDAEAYALLAMDMHDLLLVTGLPAAGGVPTSAYLWLEGWRETMRYGEHELELVVSGYCRTSPPPRWDDIDAAQTWDMQGAMTWNDATCIGPIASKGRWNDVPATTRWNQVDPAITWDTWPG